MNQLRDAGAHVEWFRPPHWYSIHKVNNRTHRKILAVDGRVGFTGGVGIAEEWTGNCETPDNWRDTHLRLEGPSVRDLVGGFQDEPVARTLEEHFKLDLEDAHELTLDEWRARPRASIARERASALLRREL